MYKAQAAVRNLLHEIIDKIPSVLFRKADSLNIMASSCLKIYKMFYRRKNFIPLWCHHFHLRKQAKNTINFFSKYLTNHQKGKRDKKWGHFTCHKTYIAICMTTSIYQLKGKSCKIFSSSYFPFSSASLKEILNTRE